MNTKHYTYTQTQAMIYKTPHIHKNTNNDLQNTTYIQHKLQNNTYTQTQTMIYTYTTNTNNDLQNTTHTQKHKQ